jgi:anthranilate phosphoribosyltransferase
LAFQILGVYDVTRAPVMARALAESGRRRAWVVHGDGGLDEVALSGPTRVWEVRHESVDERVVTPEEAGLPRAPKEALAGGADSRENAALLEAVLRGVEGPRRDAVLLNAGAALLVAGRVESLAQGVAIAAQAVDGGAAGALLDRLRGSR